MSIRRRDFMRQVVSGCEYGSTRASLGFDARRSDNSQNPASIGGVSCDHIRINACDGRAAAYRGAGPVADRLLGRFVLYDRGIWSGHRRRPRLVWSRSPRGVLGGTIGDGSDLTSDRAMDRHIRWAHCPVGGVGDVSRRLPLVVGHSVHDILLPRVGFHRRRDAVLFIRCCLCGAGPDCRT